MKKIKLLLTLSLVSLFAVDSFAQLSTATPTASVIKSGNRPQAGDWGVFVGVAYSDFQNIFSDEVTFEGFPLVNLKYYKTNQLEYRLGLQFQGTSNTLSGDIESTQYNEDGNTTTDVTSVKTKSSVGTNRIIPGLAYHFSDKNLLDVYMGANVPIGWSRNTYYEMAGDTEYKSTSTPFIVGIGGFIGFQAFVADLPLAIGLEYGISCWKEFGSDKSKVTTLSDGEEQTYFTTTSDPGTIYSSLSTSSRTISNDVRITISYYFK